MNPTAVSTVPTVVSVFHPASSENAMHPHPRKHDDEPEDHQIDRLMPSRPRR